MQLSFAGEAYESFQAAVELIVQGLSGTGGVHYMTRITTVDGEVFDAWLMGAKDSDTEWGDEVLVVRCTEDGEIEPDPDGRVESVRINEIHIY